MITKAALNATIIVVGLACVLAGIAIVITVIRTLFGADITIIVGAIIAAWFFAFVLSLEP